MSSFCPAIESIETSWSTCLNCVVYVLRLASVVVPREMDLATGRRGRQTLSNSVWLEIDTFARTMAHNHWTHMLCRSDSLRSRCLRSNWTFDLLCWISFVFGWTTNRLFPSWLLTRNIWTRTPFQRVKISPNRKEIISKMPLTLRISLLYASKSTGLNPLLTTQWMQIKRRTLNKIHSSWLKSLFRVLNV